MGASGKSCASRHNAERRWYATPCLPWMVPFEEIARVELQARLIGEDLHDDAAAGVVNLGHPAHASLTGSAQHPVVVVALAEVDLLVRGVDARADLGGPAEIERRPCDVGQLSRSE